MLRSRFSELGASLIETMVAVGILGVIAYFIVGMLRTGTLGQKTLLAQDDARVLTTNMASLLGDPIACENTFGGVAGSQREICVLASMPLPPIIIFESLRLLFP